MAELKTVERTKFKPDNLRAPESRHYGLQENRNGKP